MSKIGVFLEEVKEKLSEIDDIASLKIGMEMGIGSRDSPFIRIVPESSSKMNGKGSAYTCDADGSGGMQEMTIKIIFGFDLKGENLEKLYDVFYNLEEEIQSKLLTRYTARGSMQWIQTITDEDELVNIKSAIARFKIVGIR